MSKSSDKIFFWVTMTIIIGAITFLSYHTFFSKMSTPLPQGSSLEHKSPSPSSFPSPTFYYICEDEVKVRATPEKKAKIIDSPSLGQKIEVVGEKKEWYQTVVGPKREGKKGWIEKKYLCDIPPEEVKKAEVPEKPSLPSPPPQPVQSTEKPKKNPPPPQPVQPEIPVLPQPGAGDSAGSAESLIQGLLSNINTRAQSQYAQILFSDFNLIDGGMRFEAKATSLWGQLPQPYKNQILQVLTNQYTLIACNIGKIINCTPETVPSVSIVDASGREVAYQNSSGSQILE